MSALQELLAFQRETEALAQIAGRLDWDRETMMPRGAAPQRAEEAAALEGVLHARRTDPRLGDWLAGATARDEVEAAHLRLIGRAYARNRKVPAALAQEIARTTSLAQGIWAEARARDDVAHFLPVLTQVIGLRREEGEALAAGGSAYDALLEDYEPGATAEGIAALFARMRVRLVALRAAILGSGRYHPALEGRFEAKAQLALAQEVAGAFGYDFGRGRLDLAVHPFSSGSGLDVRITTRVSETDPLNCLYSTIHETGHAAYEQNIDRAYLLSAIGRGASMGVHESQSRIYENQLGRSRPFAGWLHARMKAHFGAPAARDADALYAAINGVQPGFIRTEADEVHYNLHIMMRFDLERALIAGDLVPADLEAAWNDRFAADFGVAVDRPSHGMLQDVHWSLGLFGYFPTYSLGNVYAGCLHEAMQAELPDLDARLAEGHLAPATDWLRQRLQCHGGLREPARLIADACAGRAPDEGPLLDYLEAKYADLYAL
ncbi:MAG: carboxypeptidase M32 [Gemmobacter sp.]|jgi:carboxypeptidase Taq